MDTRPALHPAASRATPRPGSGIISAWLALLALLVLGVGAEAQGKGKRKHPPRKAAAAAAAAAQPAGKPDPATKPAPSSKPQEASAVAVAWKALLEPVVTDFLARRPDLAFTRAWPKAGELGLGSAGASAAVRWRATLTDALAGIERLGKKAGARTDESHLRALTDWLEAELLLLDTQTLATSDPGSYLRRAHATLRALHEASWMAEEVRVARQQALLGELPRFLREARISLLAPAPEWIETAVREADDLLALLDELEAETPAAAGKPAATRAAPAGARGKPAPPAPAPREEVQAFRRWLLELLPSAGGQPPRLNADEWEHLVQLVSGSPWKTGEIKVRCLRELARVDLAGRDGDERPRRVPDPDGLALRVESGSTHALRLAQTAKLLSKKLEPGSISFAPERALRDSVALVRTRPGEEGLDILLQQPHPSWPVPRARTRNHCLSGKAQQAVLGMRYGLAGEALIERARLGERRAPPMLLESRLVREGAGLFALDWLPRIDWVENALHDDEELRREIEFQRGLEAARLAASLELHAEGLSTEEALTAFRRRTGMDEDTAREEVQRARRDPLHGIGFLGLLELRALEERLASTVGARKSTRILLLLLQRYPDLRPSDLADALASKRAER